MGHRKCRHRGQGLAEYGLLLALVALVAIVAIGLFGGVVAQIFNNLLNYF